VAFGLPIGSKLWMCSRLRTFKRRKHSVTLNAQVPDIGKAHSLADLQKLPMAQIIREAGLEPAVMQRQVSVRFPSPAVAEALGVTIYDALLTYTFLITNAESRAIEWVRIQLHPDEHARWETLDVATDSAKITAAV
jgi:DNA-binding GntR family transcriptional regulator